MGFLRHRVLVKRLIVLSIIICPGATTSGRAATCPDVVLVNADPDLAPTLRAQLGADGFATVAVTSCLSTIADVRRVDAGFVVHVTDSNGRTSERSVQEITAAIAVIESWARTDLATPLLASRAQPPTSAPAPSAAWTTRLQAAAETTLASDSSLWFGATATACTSLAPFCVGPRLRVAYDSGLYGDYDVTQSSRLDVDLLVAAELPLEIGPVTLVPGLGAGVGWLHGERTTSSGAHDQDRGGPRLDARVAVEVPLGRVAFVAYVGITVSPVADTSVTRDADGTYWPGEPRFAGELGLGIRLGGEP